MKLALCAVLSFVVMGCVDDVATGGGQLEGMDPDKQMNDPVPQAEATHYADAVSDFSPDRLIRPADRLRASDHFLADDALATALSGTDCKGNNCRVVVARWGSIQEITLHLNDAPLCRIVRDRSDNSFYTDCY